MRDKLVLFGSECAVFGGWDVHPMDRTSLSAAGAVYLKATEDLRKIEGCLDILLLLINITNLQAVILNRKVKLCMQIDRLLCAKDKN